MKPKQIFLFTLLLIIFALTACSTGITSETSTSTTDDQGSSVDTAESPLDANSPLPEPVVEPVAEPVAATEVAVKSPVIAPSDIGETVGVLTGVLRAKHRDGDVRPLVEAVVGLGELVKNDEGEGYIGVAYSASDSPRVRTDENGIFIFMDLEPKKYGLILDAVVAQTLLTYPDDDLKDIIIEIKAGEQLDLGVLEYDSVPYPGFVN